MSEISWTSKKLLIPQGRIFSTELDYLVYFPSSGTGRSLNLPNVGGGILYRLFLPYDEMEGKIRSERPYTL
jgi:hypothetical protein